MRLSEKPEAKTAGQKRSEAWFVPRPERFWPTTQASGFAASRNRLGYADRLLVLLVVVEDRRKLVDPRNRQRLFYSASVAWFCDTENAEHKPPRIIL